MTAADQDHGVVRRDGVEILAKRQALFRELRLVPVAVADEEVAGRALRDSRGDRLSDVGK